MTMKHESSIPGVRRLSCVALLLATLGSLAACGGAEQSKNGAAPVAPRAKTAAYDDPAKLPWPEQKAVFQKEGEGHASAWAFYESLKAAAGGGRKLDAAHLPDWSGVYARTVGPYPFDPDVGDDQWAIPTAKLKPEFEKEVLERIEQSKKGVEHDPSLGDCLPPGFPRWFTEPYLREFIVAPGQTWLINELANEVRRVYTDGRAHTDPADRLPLFEGDSIGFWDGEKLIVHTSEVKPGVYQRLQPKHTANLEAVEIWHKTDADHLVADVWIYDPEILAAPWFTRQTYKKQDNADGSLRLRYYDCVGASNTRVSKDESGASTFDDLSFMDEDAKQPAPSTPSGEKQ